MCGRFLMNEEALEEIIPIVSIPTTIQPTLFCHVIYPTNEALCLIWRNRKIKATTMKFGYKSENMKSLLINARAETVTSRPMFERAFSDQRCIIPCHLFYEWTADKEKVEYFSRDDKVLWMAGIFLRDCFIILTTKANASVEDVHERMPLLLREDQLEAWLRDEGKAREMLRQQPMLLDHYIPNRQPTLF